MLFQVLSRPISIPSNFYPHILLGFQGTIKLCNVTLYSKAVV